MTPSFNHTTAAAPNGLAFTGLLARFLYLACLFVTELIVISVWLDTNALDGKSGVIGALGTFGPHIIQSAVVFATVLLALGYSKAKKCLGAISDALAEQSIGWGFLAGHFGILAVFVLFSAALFEKTRPLAISGTPLFIAWLTTGLCAVAAGIAGLVPWKAFRELAATAGAAWIYATAAAVIVPVLVISSKLLWKPATAVTFELVKLLLYPLVKSVIAIPATKTLGTPVFSVQIAPSCSGLEGVGLMLLFSVLWLWFFRKDYLFPQALLLIPAGIVTIFLLNTARIAILILIGNAGAPAIAEGGFHSQAGWIAFNVVAMALASSAHRVRWLSAAPAPAMPDERRAESPVDAYLLPFLAILAAAMISRATSGTFEWLYPLRFVAAAGALLFFRHKYAGIDWKFGWAAPLAGGLVFALWIALDRFAGVVQSNAAPAGLYALPPAARIAWLLFRTLGAVITVPIAEELAFRGFLLRRLISADFESVSFQRWTFLAVAVSSIAFGLMHGDRWIAGSVAGLLYAAAQKWRGRIGDAVVAHGVTNALIAVSVLWGGQWSLW